MELKFKRPLNANPFVSKVVVLAGTCDFPAKCLVLNSIQFNGSFGCLKCLQPGNTFHIAARRHTHIYPFCCNDPNGPKRTEQQHHLDAKNAMLNGSISNGIKGPSWLMLLKNYDVVDSTAIDYMHCVLLGITKLLLSLWFGSKHSREEYYIGRSVSTVDRRLLEIQPPSCITHKPRSISNHMKYFKASEYRAFLLYYSVPALAGLLPQKYWDHHALLVIAVYWLLQQSMSSHQVEVCQAMLNKYCYQFSSLYSERYMTSNIHLLLHLPDTVKLLGPLWVYSCFQFEGQNGLLKSLVNGTRHVDKQIISTYSYIRNFPLVANSFMEKSCEEYLEAFKHLYFKNSVPQHNYLKVNDNIYMIGKPNLVIADTEMLALSLYGIEKYTKFSRMLFCGIQIHSCSWKENSQQCNNSAIAYVTVF